MPNSGRSRLNTCRTATYRVGMETLSTTPTFKPAVVSFAGMTYWADCSRCGPGQLPLTRPAQDPHTGVRRIVQKPVTQWVTDAYPIRPGPGGRRVAGVALVVCSGCKDYVSARTIKRCTSHADKPLEECGGACLSGKRNCSCRCQGRCHGLGRCVCGNASSRSA